VLPEGPLHQRLPSGTTLCVSKRIPDIIDCNLKKDYQILVMFGTNILDTTGNQMAVQIPTSPNVCFCSTCKKNRTVGICIETRKKNVKNIPDIIDCNVKKDYQILIIFIRIFLTQLAVK